MALAAPFRRISVETFSPKMEFNALITRDFPAPVSPVNTLKPGENEISSSSIRAKFFM